MPLTFIALSKITTNNRRGNVKGNLPKAISRFNLSSAKENLIIMLHKATNNLSR
jgi:hypothetical protein